MNSPGKSGGAVTMWSSSQHSHSVILAPDSTASPSRNQKRSQDLDCWSPGLGLFLAHDVANPTVRPKLVLTKDTLPDMLRSCGQLRSRPLRSARGPGPTQLPKELEDQESHVCFKKSQNHPTWGCFRAQQMSPVWTIFSPFTISQ